MRRRKVGEVRMKEHKVPVQSLIDHIKTAVDVDPWAKKMAEELLKEQEAVEPVRNNISPNDWFCGKCGVFVCRLDNYCPRCGREVKWE